MYSTPPLATAQAARAWRAGGSSLIPIAPGGLKRPATRWAPFQGAAPTLEQVDDWFGNGHAYGLAVIMGAVSGNMEMAEIESKAAKDLVLMNKIWDKIDEYDAYDVWHILHNGYLEESPSGGLHFIYRVSDHPVPGNEKIARRPATEEELAARPDNKIIVLAETRGEGGYVIVAPTSGLCHPSGEAWKLLSGEPGVVPTITWEQRNLLHTVLREALDSMPEAPAPVPPSPTTSTAVALREGLSPGDDFEQRVSWEEILLPAGWDVIARKITGETHWCRPGKDRREGMSATTGHAGDRDRLYVFSTSTAFQSEVPYTKFGAYALLNFNGDHSAAARELARIGFGERQVDVFADAEVVTPIPVHVEPGTPEQPQRPSKFYRYDDDGNGQRLAARIMPHARYVTELKEFMTWNGVDWEEDIESGFAHRSFTAIKEEMFAEAAATDDEKLEKWARRCGMVDRRNAAISTAKKIPGMSVRLSDFDPRQDLVNAGNGILNPVTREMIPHAPEYLMTRTLGANYDPQATCPTWDRYLEEVLPDKAMRDYVQRAAGYSLLGKPTRRSIFFVHGPGGTGKSTFMETIGAVLGKYAGTAAPGTFREKKGDGASPDLDELRGKRFVTTSETTEGTSFEEDLLKRIAGSDTVKSRQLYQKFHTWKPEMVLWVATNHPPKFNADDDAIWQRTKLIPFTTRFTGRAEDPDMTEKLIAEADGILNWILNGVTAYLTDGLGEPEEVREAAEGQRAASDSVARFVEDRSEANVLIEGPGRRIRINELYQMYVTWAKELGEKPLGIRRFGNRLSGRAGIRSLKTGGYMTWEGIGRPVDAAILGTFSPG